MNQICQEEPQSTCSNVRYSVEGKVVDNMCTYLLGDRLNLLSDGCLQCNNGVRVALVDIVLEETPEEENLVGWVQVKQVRCPFHFSFAANEMLPKLFMEPCHGDISSVRKHTILQEPLFFLIKVLMILKLSPPKRLLLCFKNCERSCIFIKTSFISLIIFDRFIAVHIFNDQLIAVQ